MLKHIVSIAAGAAILGTAVLERRMLAQTREAVTYHDFTKTAGEPYGPYPTTWMVVTASNSLVLAVVPDGFHQPPHYHDQEQFTLGVEGALDYSIGGVVHRVGPDGAGIPPSNVLHGMSNDSGQAVVVLEFQPVRREDWLPPHPQVKQPQSPQPKELDKTTQVTLDYGLSSSGWRRDPTGARVKVLEGRTIRASFWDVSADRASVRVTTSPTTNERFVFVLSGALSSKVGSSHRDVGPRTVIVVTPAAQDLTLESLGKAGTEIVVFDRTGP